MEFLSHCEKLPDGHIIFNKCHDSPMSSKNTFLTCSDDVFEISEHL